MRTNAEIDAEAVALQALLPKVRARSMFGDDNREAVKAQIAVLENKLSESVIYDRYDGQDYELDSALQARHWMDGEEDETPSSSWSGLAA